MTYEEQKANVDTTVETSGFTEWVVKDTYDNGCFTKVFSGEIIIANTCTDRHVSVQEGEKHARLISAAPELYAEAKDCAAYLPAAITGKESELEDVKWQLKDMGFSAEEIKAEPEYIVLANQIKNMKAKLARVNAAISKAEGKTDA